MTANELAHHGILGQKWGKRNGPPYPLDAQDHSAAEKKAGWRKSLTRPDKEGYNKSKKSSSGDSKPKEKRGLTDKQKKMIAIGAAAAVTALAAYGNFALCSGLGSSFRHVLLGNRFIKGFFIVSVFHFLLYRSFNQFSPGASTFTIVHFCAGVLFGVFCSFFGNPFLTKLGERTVLVLKPAHAPFLTFDTMVTQGSVHFEIPPLEKRKEAMFP